MRILIVSDTHRQNRSLEIVLERVGDIDMMIHLGDIEGSEDYVRSLVNCPLHMVAGNNDFFSDLDREEEFYIGKYRVFITHGHYYYVSLSSERIRLEALERNADIVMFGHTHKPLLEMTEGITVLNPGSLSYPRQEGRQGSFILMEIDPHGEAHYTINYV